MKHRSTTFQIASLLCLFAFVAMQAFGPGRLYLCLCGDQAVIQSQVACEEAGEACHAEKNDEATPSRSQVLDTQEWPRHEHHRHLAARDDLGAHALTKIAPPEVAWIPLLPWSADAVTGLRVAASSSFGRHFAGRAPPVAPPLARSFQLLI